jgi:hypothetical protein
MKRFPCALQAARLTEALSGGDLGRGRLLPDVDQAKPRWLKEGLWGLAEHPAQGRVRHRDRGARDAGNVC